MSRVAVAADLPEPQGREWVRRETLHCAALPTARQGRRSPLTASDSSADCLE